MSNSGLLQAKGLQVHIHQWIFTDQYKNYNFEADSCSPNIEFTDNNRRTVVVSLPNCYDAIVLPFDFKHTKLMIIAYGDIQLSFISYLEYRTWGSPNIKLWLVRPRLFLSVQVH